MYIWQLFRIFLTSFHHILVMQQHRIDKKNNWFFTLLQQPQTVKCQKSKKKSVRLKKQICLATQDGKQSGAAQICCPTLAAAHAQLQLMYIDK